MKQAASRTLYQYWNSLRSGSGHVPYRTAFNPMAVPSVLPHMFIIECNSDTCGKIRLAGSEFYKLYGRELTGRNFVDLWQASDKAEIVKALDSLRFKDQSLVIEAAMSGSQGDINSEFVIMPTRDARGNHQQLLAIQTVQERKWWQYLQPPGPNRLLSMRVAYPETELKLADVFAKPTENVVNFARRGRPPEDARKVAHLAVIDGGSYREQL